MKKITFLLALSFSILGTASAHMQTALSMVTLIAETDVEAQESIARFFDRNIDRNFARKFERRIHQSFGYGELSKRGARKLMKTLDWYRSEKAKALRNGKVSNREYRKLAKIQNQLNEDFYKYARKRPVNTRHRTQNRPQRNNSCYN